MIERLAVQEGLMWLKLLLTILPLIPDLVKNVETAVHQLKGDPTAPAQAHAARAALDSLGQVVDTVIEHVGPLEAKRDE